MPGRQAFQEVEPKMADSMLRDRKTGVWLPESNVRDENGMEPIDGIFSSPEKPGPTPTQGEVEMELDSGAMPYKLLPFSFQGR